MWHARYPSAVGGVCPPRKRGPRAGAGLPLIKLSGLRQRQGPEVPHAIATLRTALCDDKTDAPLVVTRAHLLACARCASGSCIHATHIACQLQIM